MSSFSSRRTSIRFAPLPDIQLSYDDHDDDHDDDDDSFSSDSVPERPPSPVPCTQPHKPTTQQMLSHHSITPPPLHWSKPRSLSLLPFPFKKLSPNSHDNNKPTRWSFGLTKLATSSPLARTQSAPTPPPPSLSQSSSQPSKLNPRKGLRMLNGRVYGGPKHKPPTANPFANVRDEDVEFVEWGYGGMGSVRGAKSAGVGTSTEGTNWSRLQHNGRNVVVGNDKPQGNPDDDDDDDGSGIGWVKKRKAARERKEKEEKERAEAQAAALNTLPPVLESEDHSPPYTRHPSSSSVATAIPSSPVDEASEHVYTAVTVPVHLPRHSRRPQPRSASIDTTMSMATVVPIPEEGLLGTESDSESDSEDGVRHPEDEYGDDDDDDEEEEEDKSGRSKTALGAGVEKISRHNQSP